MKFLHLFYTTFIVGAFTFGSGYAIIPVLKAQMVDKLHWISSKDFAYAIAVGQMTPGPLTILVAFLGWKIGGLPGAVIATVGLYLPGFVIVVLLSRFYSVARTHPWVSGSLLGIRPAVGALILHVAIDFGKDLYPAGWWPFLVGVGTFFLMSFTSLSPGWLFGGSLLFGIFFHAR